MEEYRTSLIYPLLISVSGLMVSSQRILDLMAQESYFMRHLQGINITFLPDSPISSIFTAEITVLRHALGWSLQHHSTCPFISLVVFTNSQSSLSLLDYPSNLFAPNAVWTIWSSISVYLIWPNCSSMGTLATAKYVPMRSWNC